MSKLLHDKPVSINDAQYLRSGESIFTKSIDLHPRQGSTVDKAHLRMTEANSLRHSQHVV